MSSNASGRSGRFRSPELAGLLGLLALAAAIAACGSGSTSLVGPTTPKCQISVSDFTQSFGPGGGTGTVNVEAARECAWSASTGTAWISLPSPQGGQGPGTLSFKVQPNQVPAARTGDLEVNGKHLAVSQAPAPCTFELGAAAARVPAAGGPGSVGVSTIGGCGWSASSPVPWITVGSAAGSGPGQAGYTVAPNPGAERTATLTIAGRPFAVTQDAATAAPPVPGPTPGPDPVAPCEISVDPPSLSFTASGGEGTIRVSANGTCAWQAASVADWLRVSPGGGVGPGTIAVTAAPNPATAQRSSAVSVGGQTVSVTQTGTSPTLVQLSGELRSPEGDCPNRRFTVNGTPVAASASTVYVSSSCSDLKNKKMVSVEGLQGADGTVAATRIQVFKD